jgi:hypothetical protein
MLAVFAGIFSIDKLRKIDSIITYDKGRYHTHIAVADPARWGD